jgi:hypothetical protein
MSWRGGTDVMEALIEAVKDLTFMERVGIYVKMIPTLEARDWGEPMAMLGIDAAYDLAYYRELGRE